MPVGPLLRALGAEVIVPPPPDREVLELGARLAPELMCIPFKLTLGNMVRSLDLGADTLAYTSGSWSCRYGYYGRLQRQILSELGYEYRLIDLRHDQIPLIVREVLGLNRGRWSRMLRRAFQAFRLGWLKSGAVDEIELQSRRTLPFVANPNDCLKLTEQLIARVEATEDPASLRRLGLGARAAFDAIPRNGRRAALRVKLVGESYCTIEPFVNFDAVRRLGELGVVVDPFLTAHRWLGFHGFRLGSDDSKKAKQAASRYWKYCVGGEDQSSLGHLILAAEQGYDGVVHVHPFGCMPATVVQPAMMKASQDFDIPFISISLDEHSSETGVQTRLEAFVSLLERRRRSRPGSR